ncbi:MAG: IS1182 family transposase [Anaeroplasmataceae bacterium]|nr:IS1182 family transposase [Anaeroplasmataceae bacterium]
MSGKMITKRENRTKSVMQFVDMEMLVPKDHLVRKIDNTIDFEFIREKVKHLYSEEKGRPSIDPVVLFKMVIIQYVFGIKSMRQTVKEIEVNIAYRWFLGLDFTGSVPHYSTFSKNYERRYKDSNIFEEIFKEIINQVNKEGLLNKETLFIDSTHTKAYANKKKVEQQDVEASYNKYVEKLHEEINEVRKSEGKREIEFKEAKREYISKTDPECGMFHKGEKERQLAYSTQVACDENGWVTNAKVYPGNMNDNNSGTDFIEEISQDKEVKNTVMDAGFTSPVLLNETIELGITPVVPYTSPKGKKRKTDKEESPLPATSYKFDKENNCYVCPLGIPLTYRGMNSEGNLVYKTHTKDCKNCPLKNRCTNQKYKEIQRHFLEAATEYAREIRLSPLGKELYPKRKYTIERCFAQTKFNNNLGFTFLRGIKKNQDRVLIIFACHNLIKLARILHKRVFSLFNSIRLFLLKGLFLSSTQTN